MPLYRLLGLTVDTSLSLSVPRLCAGSPVDLTVKLGEPRSIGTEIPPGELLAHLQVEGIGRVIVQNESGVVVRLFDTCDFVIEPHGCVATIYFDPQIDPAILPVLLEGPLLASYLVQDGSALFHASAVTWSERTLAILGPSGAGKSTLAALLCGAGARLLTDDTLRVNCPQDHALPCAWRGSLSLRLRSRSRSLIDLFDGAASELTADGRHAVWPPVGELDQCPISAIMIPQICRDVERVNLRILKPKDGLLELLRHSRILGWQARKGLAQQFFAAAALARLVPIGMADVPWGPPFSPEVARDLLDFLSPPRHE